MDESGVEYNTCKSKYDQKEKEKYPDYKSQNGLDAEIDLEASRGNSSIHGISQSNINKDGFKFYDAKKVVKFSKEVSWEKDTHECSAHWNPKENYYPDMDDSRSSDSSISISGLDLEEEEEECSDMRNIVHFNNLVSPVSILDQKEKVLCLKSTPNLTMGIMDDFEEFQDIQKMKSMSFLSSKIERSKGSFERLLELASNNSSWKPRSRSDLFADLEGSYVE